MEKISSFIEQESTDSTTSLKALDYRPMNQLKSFFSSRLKKNLPGKTAQNKMRPLPKVERRNDMTYKPESDSYRNSSVLVPVIMWKDEPEIMFTLRTAGIKHGGQISFPGGGKEGGETIEETALREAHEETGLEPENVEVIGQLTPLFVNHSNNMVTPVVGFVEKQQEFCANPNEVDEIFTVSISKLVNSEFARTEDWKLRELDYEIPLWDVHDVPLWGATAMMLSEFIELYREFLKG